MWSNYHTHSLYCDGENGIQEIASSSNKLISFGFFSHAALPFHSDWCMQAEAFDNYLKDIRDVQKDFHHKQIYSGLEVDYIPKLISPSTYKARVDYTIGSIHFVDQYPDGEHWEIDGSYLTFTQGLEKIFYNNIKDAVTRYYELTQEMITHSCPTILGHLDKIKIQNKHTQHFHETENWYREIIHTTIDCIKKSEVIVEVNTRGLYQKKSSSTYPSPWILELLQEKKIPITLISDAHLKEDLTNLFTETATMLYGLGFRHLSIMLDGEWQQKKFNEYGIIR